MKRIHFDSKGPVNWHNFFWEPWGCMGCLARAIGFMLLLALFLFLLSQFRSCRDDYARHNDPVAVNPGNGGATAPVRDVVPPINDDDIVDDQGRQIVGNRLNVILGAETGQAEYEAWVQKFKELYPDPVYQVLFYDPNTKLMAIQVDAERRQEILNTLPNQIPDIPFIVFEEEVMETAFRPNDPVFTHQAHAYHYDMLKAYDAWDITQGSANVIVAAVDSYFDLQNAEFQGVNIVSPFSVVTGTEDVSVPSDFDPRNSDPVMSAYAHGTMVGGFMVGAINNGKSIAGMAPKCTFMPISMSHRIGTLGMLQGILYAINHRALVVNISAGPVLESFQNASIEEQIEVYRTLFHSQETVWNYVYDMAARNYVTIVWASGNENVFTGIQSSKRSYQAINVSAVDANMRKADFSCFGNFPEDSIYLSTVSAPGVQVPGVVPTTTGYTLTDGTSFSAPIVAGCVGLIKSLDQTITTTEVIELLQSTGRPVVGDNTVGPIVQIGPALQRLSQKLIDFSALKSALQRGSGHFKACQLNYLVQEDNTALPPIFTLEFFIQSSNSGKAVYTSNRTPATILEAPISWRISDNSIVIEQQATTVSDSIRFGSSTYTITPNSLGKAVAMPSGESNISPHEFYIKGIS